MEAQLHYREIAPSVSMQPYLENFWFIESQGAPEAESGIQRCFSSGMIELVFHLGDFSAYGSYNNQWIEYPQAYFVGLSKKATPWKMKGRGKMFGVRIKPETILQLFNAPVKHFNGKFINAEELIGSGITPVIEMVMGSESDLERMFVVEAFLHSQVKAGTVTRNYFSRAMEHIRAFPDKDISEVYDKACISQRQLQRAFREKLGLTPKAYADLLRLYQAHQNGVTHKLSLTDITYELGYSDHSHFNKRFKEYFGLSPSSYFSQYDLKRA